MPVDDETLSLLRQQFNQILDSGDEPTIKCLSLLVFDLREIVKLKKLGATRRTEDGSIVDMLPPEDASEKLLKRLSWWRSARERFSARRDQLKTEKMKGGKLKDF